MRELHVHTIARDSLGPQGDYIGRCTALPPDHLPAWWWDEDDCEEIASTPVEPANP